MFINFSFDFRAQSVYIAGCEVQRRTPTADACGWLPACAVSVVDPDSGAYHEYETYQHSNITKFERSYEQHEKSDHYDERNEILQV